ncbi:MAG: hypothetical protein ACOVKR_01135, partial [Limnohabitans sp.]
DPLRTSPRNKKRALMAVGGVLITDTLSLPCHSVCGMTASDERSGGRVGVAQPDSRQADSASHQTTRMVKALA